MTRDDRSAQSAGIAGLSFLACVLIPILAQVSTLFRVYAPAAMQWLNAHGDFLREVVFGVIG